MTVETEEGICVQKGKHTDCESIIQRKLQRNGGGDKMGWGSGMRQEAKGEKKDYLASRKMSGQAFQCLSKLPLSPSSFQVL